MEIASLVDNHEFEFERIEILRDRRAGVLAFVVLHDTTLGPAFGGIRRWTYSDPGEGLNDALQLARAMTLKCAISDVPGGGGKAVIVDRPDTDRERAYSMVGECVSDWNGRYYTGPDVGTTDEDLAVVARHTERVAHASTGGAVDIAELTAAGVVAGIVAVAERLGFAGGEGAHVVVQGLGAVGEHVVCMLAARGAKLSVADLRSEAATELAGRTGATVVDAAHVLETPCDVFAPCALGGVVTSTNVGDLPARAIAGAANNVLASPEVGAELFARGVLYAPDFVINAGALITGALTHLDGRPPSRDRVLAIGDRVGEILDRARSQDLPPEVVAERLALERIQAARIAKDRARQVRRSE